MPDNPLQGFLSQFAAQSGSTSEAVIEGIRGRMELLNSQLEVFYAVRQILADNPKSTAPAVKQIRGLYEAFDQKHPRTTEGQS